MAAPQTQRSKVNEAAVLKQAVLNTSQSVELLREAVSNSVDAGAQNIDVKLENAGGDLWNVTVLDDGHGMDTRHMEAFFNAGQTEKDYDQAVVIGEKGLGSKTTFVAARIDIESRRLDRPSSILVGHMDDPMGSLRAGEMPSYTIQRDPDDYAPSLHTVGTRIRLTRVLLTKFNGKKTDDPGEIAERVLHYLRTMCATGTVKNRHAHKQHIKSSVVNVGVIPSLTVQVISHKEAVLGPESGSYPVPDEILNPQIPENADGVAQRSKGFCDVYDFTRSKTLSVAGTSTTVHYDGTAIVAGEHVRNEMLKGEIKQGWTHKSQMGLHLCKDFIPLRNDSSLSRQLLGGEYYYNFKVFLNCQSFELNADRNGVTNLDSDEVAWILDDFVENVWPNLEAKAAPYKQMVDEEEAAIKASRKTRESQELKAKYSEATSLSSGSADAGLRFVKVPKREADVSHLLAMMLQHGAWAAALEPMVRFGQYIDASTDALVEDASGAAMLVEIEYQLQNLFKHKHPMTSYDMVVVWSLGGMTNGDSSKAPWGESGKTLEVKLVSGPNGTWFLKWGTHTKRLLVLSDILDRESVGAPRG